MGYSLVHESNDPDLIPALYADVFFSFTSEKSKFLGGNVPHRDSFQLRVHGLSVYQKFGSSF